MTRAQSAPCPALVLAFSQSGANKSQIARDVGRSRRTIYAWLRGENHVPHAMREPLATALGVTVDWRGHDQHHQKTHLTPETPPQQGGTASVNEAPTGRAGCASTPTERPQSAPHAPLTHDPAATYQDPPAPTTAPAQPPQGSNAPQDPFDWLFGDVT